MCLAPITASKVVDNFNLATYMYNLEQIIRLYDNNSLLDLFSQFVCFIVLVLMVYNIFHQKYRKKPFPSPTRGFDLGYSDPNTYFKYEVHGELT